MCSSIALTMPPPDYDWLTVLSAGIVLGCFLLLVLILVVSIIVVVLIILLSKTNSRDRKLIKVAPSDSDQVQTDGSSKVVLTL